MGDLKPFPPCLRLVGAFSRYPESLEWLWNRVRSEWGEVLLLSSSFSFTESEYYHKTMGHNLIKQFSVCSLDYDPSHLASDKLQTNQWEADYRLESRFPEPRPLNIDPGYLGLTKLVLASTKNREHRIYLREGIYAEVTLAFRNQQWLPMPWTYPDYQRLDFHAFFTEARSLVLKSR